MLQHIARNKGVKYVILWGRSMGACTALMYVYNYHHYKFNLSNSKYANVLYKNPQVIGMILDSPFNDLRQLVK